MSRIGEMIAMHCPDGVQFICIKDLAIVGTGSSDRKEAVENGEYPFYVRSKDVLRSDKYLFDETAIVIPGEGGVGDIFHFVDGKYDLHQRAYRIHFIDNRVDPKYAYYYFCYSFKKYIMKKSVEAIVTSIRKPMIDNFPIPVPPLCVQHKIVEMLDNFSALSMELSAEHTARRKQYEYYTEKLILSCPNTVQMKISDVCSVYDGTHQTPSYTDSGVKFVSVENIDDVYATTKYISEEDYQKYKVKPQINDVLMTRITAGVIGKCFVINRTEKLAYYVSLALLRPNPALINSHYLKYYIECGYGKKEMKKFILTDATPPKINKDAIGKVKILVPPLEEQERIVKTIHPFDMLCHDAKQGLPAEIKARQQQYEYYRDKLLTFETRT